MKVVADTDILSIFARINRLDILDKLFEEVIIPQSVKSELSKGNIKIGDLDFRLGRLTKEELKALKKTDARLDKGERECFVIAKYRGVPLASNERIVHALCKKEDIGYFSLPRIFRLAILQKVITREEARELIRLIEREDNTIVKNKEEIFK